MAVEKLPEFIEWDGDFYSCALCSETITDSRTGAILHLLRRHDD
ncbi:MULTISPECIES: hypothetical protein [Halorussus]|nr:hypothetical protein [Halorussus vallis]